MATGTILLPLLGGIPHGTIPPGVGFDGSVPYLTFDQTTDEIVTWSFQCPENYASGPEVIIGWSGSSSTTVTHDVVWSARMYAYTYDTDSTALDAKTFDTANTVTDAILGTTAKRGQTATITMTNNDSLAADDFVVLELRRDADVAGDDLPEDAWLWSVKFEYTTT